MRHCLHIPPLRLVGTGRHTGILTYSSTLYYLRHVVIILNQSILCLDSLTPQVANWLESGTIRTLWSREKFISSVSECNPNLSVVQPNHYTKQAVPGSGEKDETRPVVPKMCSADLKGYVTSFQGIRGYIL